MHTISYNPTTESSFKILISTLNSKVIFNNSGNLNNITIYLDKPINIVDESNVFLVSFSSFQIPISWPLISEYNGNNIFSYILNGTTYTYTIPDGSYSITDIVTLLKDNTLLSVS